MSEPDQLLDECITKALKKLELDDEIVVCSSEYGRVTSALTAAVQQVLPVPPLTEQEMLGVRSLIIHAIGDENFFDWEMPTLTGFSAAQFKQIAEKLPQE